MESPMPSRHPLLDQAFALSAAGRNPEAILIINQLAAQEEPDALFTLAEMKWRGGMVPQDLGQARELYRRAGDRGHSAAACAYTNLLASGIAGGRDWPRALKRLRGEARGEARRRLVFAHLGKMQLTPEGDPATMPQGRRLSDAPNVILYERLFSAVECDYLMRIAEPDYAPSTVYDSNRRLVRDPIRTSDGSTIHWLIEDPVVHALNRRMAAASGSPAEHGEALQVLRYRPGQQYHSHLDFAVTSENLRRMTALAYLNDEYAGGETCFVKTGLKVKGRKGDVLVFCNATPDRRPDPMSEHAGLPVTRGTKFLASRWIRERRWVP